MRSYWILKYDKINIYFFCTILLIAKKVWIFCKIFKNHPLSIRKWKRLEDQRFLSTGRKIWREMLIAYVTNREWQGKRWFTDKEDEKSFRYWTVKIRRKRYSDVRPKSQARVEIRIEEQRWISRKEGINR